MLEQIQQMRRKNPLVCASKRQDLTQPLLAENDPLFC
jgi:hypothetical protein